MKEMVAAERRELAELLGGLSEEQWDAPSLCAGWRVREVVAHMTAAFRAERADYELATTPDDLNARADRLARAEATSLTSAELTAAVRDNVDHPWRPLGRLEGALAHDVIHGLDITVALDLGRQVPLPRLRVVLETLTPDRVAFFGVDLTGMRLVASDLEWAVGAGEPRVLPAQELLLVLCGRRAVK